LIQPVFEHSSPSVRIYEVKTAIIILQTENQSRKGKLAPCAINIIRIKKYMSSLMGFLCNILFTGYKYSIPYGIFWSFKPISKHRRCLTFIEKRFTTGFENTIGVQRFCSTLIRVGEFCG
jgi:hypothetical protein